jgi:O-antigen/teichoic acid export membrane protein
VRAERNEIVEAGTEAPNSQGRGPFSWIGEAMQSYGREYWGTFATEFTVLACQLLTYKLAAHFLGMAGFSEYAVAKRTISLIQPLPLLGLGTALPRYIAYSVGQGSGARSARYFGAAAWCVMGTLIPSTILMNLFPSGFAYLFFADRKYANLVFALSLMLAGLALHTLAYSYFRGHLAMKQANLLQLFNVGILPIAAFLIFSHDLRAILLALGLSNTLTACAVLVFTPLRHAAGDVLLEGKELLRYGIQRLPGDFLQMALLALPVAFVAHTSGLQRAGSVAFGISFLTLVAAMFSPLGLVLMPKAARMFAEGATQSVAQHVAHIARMTVILSFSISVMVALSAGTLVRVYLGSDFGQFAKSIRLTIWGAVPFCLYFVLRGVVDAFHRNGVNTRNLFFAFAVFAFLGGLSWFLGKGEISIVVSLLVSLYCLGILTFWETRKIAASLHVGLAFGGEVVRSDSAESFLGMVVTQVK